MRSLASKSFLVVCFLGIIGAFYHAWAEGAFTTNYALVHFAPYASFYGIPYWVFGVVWFPPVFVVALWATKIGKVALNKKMLALLTIGNIFTGYLWYLDLVIIHIVFEGYTVLYLFLYLTNYVMTALVVIDNRSSDVIHGYVYGTFTGAVVGLLFGPYGVAACGIGGGIFGALRNYAMPIRGPAKTSPQTVTGS